MGTDLHRSEKLSFWQLLQRTAIEIPIIQRDYAQGRQDKVRIRKDFLDALGLALERGTPVELDFVYGSYKSGSLQPLDGQQRLTTLFLLHWYAATAEGCLDAEVKKTLEKFTYETRISSGDFCRFLVGEGMAVDRAAPGIAAALKDAPGFCLSWEKDPTIKAMLIMLDAIHLRFSGNRDLWQKLSAAIDCPITFHYLELRNFGLSDDLYIKMNARGKQLTPFANFKARFGKRIEDNGWDAGRPYPESFALLADTVWTDLFWKVELHKDGHGFDVAYIKFIAEIMLHLVALRRGDLEAREKRIKDLFNHPEQIAPEDFDQADYEYLYACLNAYCRDGSKIVPFPFPFWQHLAGTGATLFSALTGKEDATYQQRALFYAQTCYLVRVAPFDGEGFQRWMRFARNIVVNTAIDSAESFIGAINLFSELSLGAGEIHTFLTTAVIDSKFAAAQVSEEILKAKLIVRSIHEKDAIFALEDLNFCRGRIGFALYCIDFEKDSDLFDVARLAGIGKVMHTYLDKDGISNDLRRALLTVGDNEYYKWFPSWVYVLDMPKYCLLTEIGDFKLVAYKNKFRDYLKGLLNSLVTKSPVELVDEFVPPAGMPAWKVRLLREREMLDDQCKSRYLAVPDDLSCCYLLRVGRPRSEESCYRVA
jgi:hypothetical protein